MDFTKKELERLIYWFDSCEDEGLMEDEDYSLVEKIKKMVGKEDVK